MHSDTDGAHRKQAFYILAKVLNEVLRMVNTGNDWCLAGTSKWFTVFLHVNFLIGYSIMIVVMFQEYSTKIVWGSNFCLDQFIIIWCRYTYETSVKDVSLDLNAKFGSIRCSRLETRFKENRDHLKTEDAYVTRCEMIIRAKNFIAGVKPSSM